MKLMDLAIDGFGVCRELRLGRFSDGLNILFGETGSGKSTIRRYIQNVLFGFDHDSLAYQSTPHQASGYLDCFVGNDEYRLTRGTNVTSEIHIDPRQPVTHALAPSVSTLSNIDAGYFAAFYNIGFHQTHDQIKRIARELYSRLGVPTGIQNGRDEQAYLSWKQRHDSLQSQFISLKNKLDSLGRQKLDLQSELDRHELARNEQVRSLDRQIGELTSQINLINTGELSAQLTRIVDEIHRLRHHISTHETRVRYVETPTVSNQHSSLYERLDELENQIRRWRRVQSDIQSQRVRLRDEMLQWNELTLESDQHPYHVAREILVALESKVDRAEYHAKENSGGVSQVDIVNFSRDIAELCSKMRQDIYGLCQELGHQYKHIRHKAAAAELKQLRRCYNEMGENTKLLAQRRESLIEEIRLVDPAGADAIARADHAFCQCAQHEGYLTARRKLVPGQPMQIAAPTPVYSVNELTSEHERLAVLERERTELTARIESEKARRMDLQNRKSDLILQRDRLLAGSQRTDLIAKIDAITAEMNNLTAEHNRIASQLESDRFVETPPNATLERANTLLSRMSLGDLQKVWLSTDGTSVVALNRGGTAINFDQLSRGQQDQVALSLSLAASESLKGQGTRITMLLDDVFANLDAQRVAATLDVLKEFALGGQQILAFAKRNELNSVAIGSNATVFELPQTHVSPAVFPEGTPYPSPRESTPYRLPENYGVTTRELDYRERPTSIDPFVPSPTSELRPYPLNKYDDLERRMDMIDDRFQAPPTTSPAAHSRPTVVSIDETATIAGLDLLDSVHLERLSDIHVHTVGQLLELDPEDLGDDVIQIGLTHDQIDRWQSYAWLMTCIPGLRSEDARVLVACGIVEPEHLDTTHSQQLFDRLHRFLSTSEGNRYASRGSRYTMDSINDWYRALDTTRNRWRGNSGYSRRSRRTRRSGRSDRNARSAPTERLNVYESRSNPREPMVRQSIPRERSTRKRPPREREPRATRNGRSSVQPREPRIQSFADRKTTLRSRDSKPTSSETDPKLKFYLDTSDHIEAAPSIGPKTAERFEKIGVVTVGDFLKQTAESMANKLNYKRITAEVVRLWQQQTRLVCRIPNLRGHDAQLLVACGYTEPENIAIMRPERLFDVIGPFSETKDGLKIIRSGKKPDLAEIKDWIQWAGHTRSLQAA